MKLPDFTYQQKKFIRENYLKLSSRKLAEAMDCSKTRMVNYLRDNNLVVPKDVAERFRRESLTGRTTFTQDMDRKIRAEYLQKPIKIIAAELGRSYVGVMGRLKAMGLTIPPEIIEERKKASLFQPGHESDRKGKKMTEFLRPEVIEKLKRSQFKKGNLPHNTKRDGAIEIRVYKCSRTGKPYHYKWIRISKGEWKQYHAYKWEKKYGPVPDGMFVVFKNKNTLDCGFFLLLYRARGHNLI